MKRVHRLMTVFVAALLMAMVCLGQAPGKKTYTFHGKVEAVDDSGKTLKVNGEKVEGWMEAMTMNYKVDDPAILKKVKTGDQISATVYDGDYVLYKVQVVPKTGDSKSKK